MEQVPIAEITELIQSLGYAGVFMWLYFREKTAHEETRKEYRADLREIAGMRVGRLLEDDPRETTEFKKAS